MTREEVAKVVERRQASVRDHDLEALASVYAENCLVESPVAGTVTGRGAVVEVWKRLFAAFPDFTYASDEPIIDGLRAAVVTTATGTDTGGFMGRDPTGKPFEILVVQLYTLRDGVIAHERRVYDFTGLLVQIGSLKAKPA